MGEPVTKDDLREAKNDLRLEFAARINGVEDTFKAEIRGLNRGLWLKLGLAGFANVGVLLTALFAKTNPERTQTALALVERVIP